MSTAKLKIAGAWSGILEADLNEWTIPFLKQQILSKIDNNCSNDSINLICAGKVLKDDDQSKKLVEFGVKNNSKILVTRVSPDHGKELVAEEEKTNRLQRLKFFTFGVGDGKGPEKLALPGLHEEGKLEVDYRAAATSLATRHADGSLPLEDFNLELENQSGEKVQLGSENDQRALMTGLMFHGKAKQLVKKKMYEDAVEVLAMGEESFFAMVIQGVSSRLRIEALSMLMGDGVWTKGSKKGPNAMNLKMFEAVLTIFLSRNKAKKQQKREDDIKRRDVKSYTVPQFGSYEKELLQSRLERNENRNSKEALDDLNNPETNSDIGRKRCWLLFGYEGTEELALNHLQEQNPKRTKCFSQPHSRQCTAPVRTMSGVHSGVGEGSSLQPMKPRQMENHSGLKMTWKEMWKRKRTYRRRCKVKIAFSDYDVESYDVK
ncbi:NEDD8 ultimate buster 1 [Tanacetum coccineum]